MTQPPSDASTSTDIIGREGWSGQLTGVASAGAVTGLALVACAELATLPKR